LAAWLVDQPVDLGQSLFGASASFPISIVFAQGISRGRVRRAAGLLSPPPRTTIHETVADGRERHARAVAFILLGVVGLFAFDRATGGGGTMVGLVAGLCLAIGAVDLFEARRWRKLETSRRLRLYILLPARALMGGLNPSEIYALPSGDDRPTPGPFELPIGLDAELSERR
jgi:hypothetical protein